MVGRGSQNTHDYHPCYYYYFRYCSCYSGQRLPITMIHRDWAPFRNRVSYVYREYWVTGRLTISIPSRERAIIFEPPLLIPQLGIVFHLSVTSQDKPTGGRCVCSVLTTNACGLSWLIIDGPRCLDRPLPPVCQ